MELADIYVTDLRLWGYGLLGIILHVLIHSGKEKVGLWKYCKDQYRVLLISVFAVLGLIESRYIFVESTTVSLMLIGGSFTMGYMGQSILMNYQDMINDKLDLIRKRLGLGKKEKSTKDA